MTGSIVEDVSRFLTPELVSKLATASGLDNRLAQEGVAAAVPAILSALSTAAGKPDGARRLASAIAQQPPDTLRALTSGVSNLTPQLAETGSSMLSTLLGGNALGTLTSILSRFLGVSEASAKTIVAMLTPMIMGVLGRTQAAQGLDTAGLTGMLAQQKDAIAGAMPAGLASLFQAGGSFAGVTPDTAGAAARVSNFPPGPAMARASSGGTQASPTRWPLWTLAALIALGALLWSMWDRTSPPAPTATAPAPSAAFLAKVPDGWVTVRDGAYADQDVYTSAGEKIGTIKYVLKAPNGSTEAAVIGLARVLGIGEKDICVPLSAFKRQQQGSEQRIVLEITKDGLQAVPPFQH